SVLRFSPVSICYFGFENVVASQGLIAIGAEKQGLRGIVEKWCDVVFNGVDLFQVFWFRKFSFWQNCTKPNVQFTFSSWPVRNEKQDFTAGCRVLSDARMGGGEFRH